MTLENGTVVANGQVVHNKTDGNASFLRAARAGNLDKVIEWLKGNVDINTSNANGLNALHLASKEGHVNVVTELIKRGANVNAATKKGNASLHIASLAGQEEVVKILVQNGANVNVQSQNGFTPLYMAAQENHDNVLRFLLANGANQSLATEDGFTPLAVALQQGHDKVVALLLENDTKGKVRLPALHIAAKKDDCKAAALLLQSDHNPDVTSKSGFTPLHIAAHYGNDNIATLLLEKGADVNFTAKHQITPLHVAAKWGKANMVSLLIEKGANIDASTRDGLTPLHCAARSGHDSVVDQLLDNGAPISAKTKNGLAPLHMSSQGDHVDSARILLYHKAPVDDITVDYLTALHVAAHCGHVNVAKLLLDRSADPNSRALNGFTPLHIACKKNRIKVVELLLKHGASIEATTESGLTPLHVASFMGCMNIVIYLIQNGANPDVPTVRGETPLHLAARANQTDIIRILLRNGAHVDAAAREEQTPLHIAARLGNVDIVSLLLQHGAAVDATTKDMYTALHVAAKEGQEEVASVLLDHGASLTATTKKGLTPLHMAAKYGNIKVARLLLHKDAPVDAQGKNGVTPLHVAAHYDHVNVALLLLDKGASPHATAKNGYTPLHISAKKNQMDIATTLLEYGAKAGDESKAGFTSLHLAAQEGHTDMATLLIEHNADVNAKAKNGLTPLHLCAQEDKVNVAAILVKNGADIDPQTRAGYMPLHVACHFGQINMVRFLLQHSADVNSTTSHGYTPLHQAAQQGHSLIINLLLENQASPNITSTQGQTPLSIAQRLGYISVVETLKVVTETVVTTTTTTVVEEKYKVVAPETMQETFMSDSEDEAGDDTMLGDQSYRYLTADEMKSLGDDSLPIDVTKDERATDSMTLIKESAAPLTIEEDHLSPQHAQMMETSLNGSYSPDNIDISHAPIHAGDFKWDDDYLFSAPSNGMWRHSRLKWKTFLVSFMVDARGGAMRGCRHSGVRVIIPPRKAPMPMRITCRYLRKEKLAHPPPLMEGEACASRILEMGPVAARFLGPVIIEVPHFASLRGKEREITILRSDNGETWREHALEASEEAVQEVLNESFEGEELSALEDLNTNRITRILTTDFPQYFAIITRIRQEVHAVGPEGGMVSSAVVPQVQAIFPEGALTKKIKVGLQAQPIQPDLVAKLLGNRVAVSPIVTVEPRRRKFHKPITLTIPVPQAATKGMINQYSGDAPTLRLLCSITGSSKSGGPSKAQWEDVTGSTPLTFINECVSFTTTVSARFWLMDCRQVSEATKFATELYQEAIHVPFMGKFVIFAKRHEMLEAQLRVFCMTDDKEDKTLESQEHFIEIAKSRDVEVLENKQQYLEFAGNLVPVTKSGDQLFLTFHAFRENRLPFSIRVKDPLQEPMGRIAFMKEPRAGKSEPQQTPICNLNIALPEILKTDVAELITLERKYGFVQEIGLAKPELIHRADLRLSDIARGLDKDWVALALQLDISEAEINSIKSDCPDDISQQALIMLRRWMQKSGPRATGNRLEKALRKINREDIPKHCMFNVELVTDDVEKAVAKVHLDQSGFETFKEELGPSRDASLKREVSLDVSYDEQDLMKEAESTVETSSESEHVKKDIKDEVLPEESLPIKKEIPSPSSEVKEGPATPIVSIPVEPKPSEDIKHVTSAMVESQEVLGDGTIKRTVTTVTTTTVVMDGEEISEQDMQDHTAKLAESETWASEMDTSQVSISSLPEDEKSEPTTATISSSTAAEPEPDIVETPTEEKEWSEADEKELGQTAQMTTSSMIEESRPSEEVSVEHSSPILPKNCDPTFISISNSGFQLSSSVASDNCFPDGDIKSDNIDSNLFLLKSSKTGSSYESIYDESKLSFNDNVNQHIQNKFNDNNIQSTKIHNGFKTSSFENLYIIGKGEERGAVSHEDPCESTVADTQHTKHEIIIAKKPDIESSENGDKPITETKDYYDHVSTTLQKSKCDEPSFIEIEESIDIQPTEINEKEIKTKTLSPEASIVFEHDVRTVDSETDVSSLPYEMPVDVTDKPDLEPELESTVKPVVTTPVSERKHKPESKPRRSQIPVYDVTGKYDGPEIKHIEPIIIEPEDDKDSLMIDRHHSTPDFRQLAGTDLEAILEEHAKDEQLRAVSESADIEDHFSPLHKGKPSAHLSSSPSDVPSPTSSPLLIEAFDSVVESEVFPIAEDESKLVTGLPTSVDVSASEISASCDSTEISVKIKENEMATESEDVFPIEETIYKTEASELHTIETTIEVSSTSTMSVTSQEQDTTAFPPNRIQMAFDNSAFVGVDMIDSTDNVDRDMARSPYEVVRRDIEDFKIGDDIKISVSEEEHVDTTELTKFNVLPTREEATKLAHEIIEEIKTEVAKRPPLKQVSSEISDEDLVEHEDSLDDTSLVNDMTDLKQPMLSETTAILDKELLFESPKEYKEFISEEETIISSREEHECHIKMEEKSCQNENNLEILAHTATSASDQDPLSITESTTALLLTNASPIQATYEQKMEKEIAIQPKGESDSAESETHFAITEAVPIASSPDESFGSSGSESKQHAVSDAIEADMHDSDSCLWDSTHRCSGQYVHGELVDEMAESVIKQIESLPTNATASSAVEDIDKPTYHSQINGPLEVDYIPEYDDEQYCSEEIKKDQHADLKPFSDDEGKVDSEKSANAQVEPTTSEIQLTETSQAAKQILPIVQITETRDSNTDFVEDYGFLPQQASLFDDQADQEIKKILSDESQTEDDRMTDIIERPLTPEPSEDMLTDENLLPESEQSSLKTNHSLETVQQITEKDEIIREEIIKCERVDSSSFMEEISDLDVTSSKMVESFAVKSSFQQDDLTQEEAMDIGSDKCDERDDIDEPEKLHAYEYGVHFASEPDYDEIPKYVESGYGDLYTHQEEDEDIFDEDIQESRNLVEGDKQIYPDLDNLLGPKFNTKSGEHDDSSVSSLQEFERFEAEIATGRKLSQGSVDSLNEHPPISKSGEHDDVSMNSLTEFERLERECAEAERIENVASEEAARLSEIEEGHESQASEASHETLSGPEDMDSIDSDDYEKRLSEIDEIIRQAQCNVEKFQEEPLPVCSKHAKQSKKISLKIVKDNKDIILDKSFHGVCEQVDANVLDSNLNRVAVPEQESKDLDSLEDDVTANMIGTCVGLPSTAADSHDVDLDSLHDDHSHSIEHDSLHETKQDHEQDSLRDDKTGDLDSLQEEMQILMQDSLYEERDLDQDSLHESIELPKDELDSKTSEILISDKRIDEAEFEDSLHEDLCTSKKDLEQEPYEVCAKVDYMISSTDSLEPSSSAATHATYQFDTDSIMSSSLNSVQASGEETLMASSTDSIDPERMSYIYANATITESPMHIESQYNYLLDSEGNVHQRSGQTDTDNIHTSFEAVQKLHSVDNVKKIVTISSDNNIYHEETKTMMPIEFQVKLGDSDSSVKSKLKSVEINGLQDTQSSISQDSIENGDIDQEGNIIKNDIQISQDTMFSNKLTKSIESLMEQQNEKFIVGEDSLRRKADHSGENVKIIPSTKPGEQIEEIRSTDEHGNIQIIRRIKRVVTVQRESVSSPESGKSDMSEPVEEVRTMDEKGNVKVIRRIRRIIRLSDSQSSDIDKQQLQGIFQNDDSQATSPDISQADSLQERFHYDSILKTSDIQTASQEVRSGRESVCSIRSDFSDTDSDIREFRTTDERGNVIIRRVRRIVTPLPPESNSRSSSPHSIEEKRMVDDKGNVIIRRVKRIIKVQQSDISENRDLTKIHSSVLSDEGGKSKEPKIVDEDDSVKQVVQTPDLSESIEATAIILKDCPQQSAEPPFDIPNGVTNSDDSTLPPKHTTFQSSDRAAIEEVRTVDEKGNVKIIRIRKRTIPYSSTEGQTDNDDVEQRLRDFLKSSSASESTNEEEVKEERSFDEKGNVVIVRTVKRHTASEPQVYSKTFTGSQAEQQSKEYVKTFDSLQSREDISEYQATDDEGNVVRVTQEVRVEPHIKTLSFTGPDVRQQMDEYLRLHKDSSQTFQSHPKYPTHSTSGSTSNGFTQSRTDTPSHVLTEDPYSPLETVLPFDTSSHQVESNGIQPVSGTALQFSKEQRRPQRSVQFEDFIHQDVEPTSDGKDSNLDGLQHCQSDPAEDARMADKNAEELTDHSELPI